MLKKKPHEIPSLNEGSPPEKTRLSLIDNTNKVHPDNNNSKQEVQNVSIKPPFD